MSGAVNGIGYLHDAISTPIVRNTLVSGWLFYPHKVVKPHKYSLCLDKGIIYLVSEVRKRYNLQ